MGRSRDIGNFLGSERFSSYFHRGALGYHRFDQKVVSVCVKK
jgi:hypothetical protein